MSDWTDFNFDIKTEKTSDGNVNVAVNATVSPDMAEFVANAIRQMQQHPETAQAGLQMMLAIPEVSVLFLEVAESLEEGAKEEE